MIEIESDYRFKI